MKNGKNKIIVYIISFIAIFIMDYVAIRKEKQWK